MSASKLVIPAPKIQDRQFTEPLLCGPGPCNVWPSVKEALTRSIISPFCDETFNVLDDIRAGLQYIFQTRSKMIFAVSGSGHAGMETIISNLICPNKTLLIASRGIWDERALGLATRYGIKTEVYKIPFNTTFSLEKLELQLRKVRPAALFITHGDSSTGTIQTLEGLGALCHKYDTLLLVDSVVSLIGVPFLMDEWEVDAVYSSTQKALSGPAGISPVAFSERAQKIIETRKFQPPFYFDAKLLALQWNCFGNTRSYHHTMSPPLLWALRCCLIEVTKETLPKSWERHATVTAHFHKRMQQLGLEFLVPEAKDRLITATTIGLPKGYDYGEFLAYMRKNHNIIIFGGLGPTAGKSLRIGIMGVNSTTQVADAIADAMADTLKALNSSL